MADGSYVTDAGEGQMHAGHQDLAGRRRFIETLPRDDGLFLIDIVIDGDSGFGELDGIGIRTRSPQISSLLTI